MWGSIWGTLFEEATISLCKGLQRLQGTKPSGAMPRTRCTRHTFLSAKNRYFPEPQKAWKSN